MTLGERIKKVRKDKDLTQQQFAEKIGTSANVLTNYETGRRNPSSSVINNICKTFNVNDKWLREGTGEIYGPKPTAALELLAIDHNLTHGDYILIEKFLCLKPETRKAILNYALEVTAALASEDYDGVSPDTPVVTTAYDSPGILPGIPIIDEDIKLRAARYVEQSQDSAYSELQQAGIDPEIEAEVEAYRQRRIQEKKQASQTSVAKERGAG